MTQERLNNLNLYLFGKGIYYHPNGSTSEITKYAMSLAIEIFGCYPVVNSFLRMNKLILADRTFTCPNIEVGDTYENILKAYPDTITYRDYNNNDIDALINDEFIILSGWAYCKSELMFKRLQSYIQLEQKTNDQVYYVTCDGKYFDDTQIKIKVIDDIEDNYNDDLPNNEITKIINDTGSGLLMFYGEPGTGKTSYIRNLVNKNPDIPFYFMDSSILQYTTNTEFINYLTNNKNSIYILEDCEEILKSRETGYNSLISSLLNISDGLLGDSLNIKFICTFNTNLSEIDSALLRKGRLKLKYEFKKLSKDKVEKKFKKLGIDAEAKEMPLCDVYNFYEPNYKQDTSKIGFK